MSEPKQGQFNDWAIVEAMGHQRFVGFVTTEAYGGAVLFRVDVPELPERQRTLSWGEYVGGKHLPAGTTITESPVPGYTKLIGAGSIYAITPCTEEAARAALNEIQPRKLMHVTLPPLMELSASAEDDAEGAHDPDFDDIPL